MVFVCGCFLLGCGWLAVVCYVIVLVGYCGFMGSCVVLINSVAVTR